MDNFQYSKPLISMTNPVETRKYHLRVLGLCLFFVTNVLPGWCSDRPVMLDVINANTLHVGEKVIRAYMIVARLRLQNSWNPPLKTKCKPTLVYFELTADGKVDIINMSRSSGDQTADDAAIRAVRKTLFETLPDGVKNLLVNARFDTMKSGSFAPAPVGRSSSRPMAHA